MNGILNNPYHSGEKLENNAWSASDNERCRTANRLTDVGNRKKDQF